MSFLDSVGGFIGSIVAVILMLILAVISFFITVFIVQTGANIAGLSPNADYIVLSAAILVAGAIVAGASPLSAVAGTDLQDPDKEP